MNHATPDTGNVQADESLDAGGDVNHGRRRVAVTCEDQIRLLDDIDTPRPADTVSQPDRPLSSELEFSG